MTYDDLLHDAGFPTFEERIARVDPTHTVKGVFFDDIVAALGPELESHFGELVAPPRTGRFLAFSSYPLRDHATLLFHTVRKLHPNLSMREGFRRTQRGNVEAFARTTPGRVITAMMSDLRKDFGKIPEAFRLGRVAGHAEAFAIEDRAIEVRLTKSHPWVDCGDVGTLEGVATFFDTRFRIEVELSSDVDASYVCRFLRD